MNSEKEKVIEVKNLYKDFYLTNKNRSSLLPRFIDLFKNKTDENTVKALKDISFSVNKGEKIGIIGYNGSGKSTLLKILAGIYFPTNGKVISNNQPFYLTGFGKGMNGSLTLKENIFLTGYIIGLRRGEIEENVEEIITFAKLDGLLNRQLRTLSSGMITRFVFSTFIHFANYLAPDIILLDEVFGGGGTDIRFKQWGLEKMEALIKGEKTIVMVTHSLGLVQKYCDRAIWLHNGVIKADGDVEEVVQKYIGSVTQKS